MIYNYLKISLSILKNNLFLIKIIWKISKIRFLLKTIITIINSILPAFNILIIRYIISILENTSLHNENTFRKILFTLIFFIVIQVISKGFESWNSSVIEPIIASKINMYMNEIFIEKIKEFEYSCFEDSIFFDKYTRALNQTDSITHSVFNSFFNLLSSFISISSLMFIVITLDWVLILFVCFNVIVNFIQSVLSAKLNFNTSQTLTPMSRKQNYIKRILYIPDYAKDVKYNDIISTGKKYYKNSLKDIVKIIKKYGIKIAIINSIVTILLLVCSGSMIIFLFLKVWFGVYGISDFSALNTSATQLENKLNNFFNSLSSFYSNSLEIENLKFIYYYKNKKTGYKNLTSTQPCKIEVKNLWFKYPNSNEYTLKDISFSIKSGEKVSIVGLNGSGKTTLIKLILGLYQADKGEIYINDIPIHKYSEKELQDKISVVFQDNHVYAYSIKENIAFENDIKNESIKALKDLDIYDKFKTLPNSFNTILSREFDENGINISGGEAQKICIARAFNKNSVLYIFDEPSSALDPLSELKMNKVMLEIKNKTVILISHRLTTVTMTDKIIMLENGKLIEQGTHSELMSLNGKYANLFKEQNKNAYN